MNMQSDPGDCTSDYFSTNEKFDDQFSPVQTDSQAVNNRSHTSESIKQEGKKRKSTIEDDFFALSTPNMKKKKKKTKKSKIHKNSFLEDSFNLSADDKLCREDNTQRSAQESIEKSNFESVEVAYNLDSRSITPPPVKDKNSVEKPLRSLSLLEKFQDIIPGKDSDDSEDDSDEGDVEVSIVSVTKVDAIGSYQFSDDNEKNRKYVIRVLSKLSKPINYPEIPYTDFGTKGTKKFSRISEAISKYFKSLFINSPEYSLFYDEDKTALIWVEGKMEIKPFFKPSTLRIPPPETVGILSNDPASLPPTMLTCLLVPKDNLSNFLTTYPEFKHSSTYELTDLNNEIEVLEIPEKKIDEDEFDDDKDDITIIDEVDVKNQGYRDNNKGSNNFFVIGLKGKDNRRIDVQVSPETKIRKLLTYYLKVKNIDESTVDMATAKIIFDDEELNLEGVIGNTELEEDFEVQIVI